MTDHRPNIVLAQSVPPGVLGRLLRGEPVRVVVKGAGDQAQRQPDQAVSFDIRKLNEDKRLAYGWASVIEKEGAPVIDTQGDIITEHDLVTFAHLFKIGGYGGKIMHQGEREAELMETAVFTKDIQEALGIDLGFVGWWVCFYYPKVETWARIKSGELPMFSIAGKARRVEA